MAYDEDIDRMMELGLPQPPRQVEMGRSSSSLVDLQKGRCKS
jgi:hypothetical protein